MLTHHILILEAAKHNNVSSLQSLMTPEDYTNYIHDVMTIACKNGSLEVIKFLCENYFAMPDLGEYFYDVIQHSQYHVLEYLLEQGADPNYLEGEALNYAINFNSLEAMKLLFKYHATPPESLFHALFKTQKPLLIQLFLEHCTTPYLLNEGLERACALPYIKSVPYFLKKGADIHYRDDISLRHAIANNDIALVQLLVENEATIDTYTNQNNPILVTVANGNQRLLDYFIEQGYDIVQEASRLFVYTIHSNSPVFIEHFMNTYQPDIFFDDCRVLHEAIGTNAISFLDYILPFYYQHSPNLITDVINKDMTQYYASAYLKGIAYTQKFLTEQLTTKLENSLTMGTLESTKAKI